MNIVISIIRKKGRYMERDYTKTINGVIQDLKDAGENPDDYTDEQIESMIENGF